MEVSQREQDHSAAAAAVVVAALDSAGAAATAAVAATGSFVASVATACVCVCVVGCVAPKLNAGMATPVGALIPFRRALMIVRPAMTASLARRWVD